MLRRDDWVTDAMGNALSGASVYVCSQPATTTTIPPSPLAQLYSDPAGAFPITQPVITDGFGHAFFYAAAGTYTVVYYSPQILETILPDQNIGSGNVSFPITVAQGGTNATTAAQARINLSTAASGTNADITSLTAIPNIAINSTGMSANNGITATTIGFGTVGTNNITSQNINNVVLTNAGAALRVGTGTPATPALIQSFATSQALSIGTLGNPTIQTTVIIASNNLTPTTGLGLLGFDANYCTQTTVGAAGAASALPGVPRGYLQFTAPDGTICVLPFWKAS